MQIEWNDHGNHLIKAISGLLDLNALMDVTLSAEGRQIKAHRLVLAAASDYFREILTPQVDQSPIIFLKDVTFKDLESLVKFIYTGNARIESSHLTSFMGLAKSLGIKGFGGSPHPGGENYWESETPLVSQVNDHLLGRSPSKRKLADRFSDKENLHSSSAATATSNSTLKHNLSEPVNLCNVGNAKTNLTNSEKKRKLQSKSLDGKIPVLKSSDNVIRTQSQDSTQHPNNVDDSIFKQPLPPPGFPAPPVVLPNSLDPSANDRTLKKPDSPTYANIQKPGTAAKESPTYVNVGGHLNTSFGPDDRSKMKPPTHLSEGPDVSSTVTPNRGFDSSATDPINPEELAAKGAKLLHHLAHWMIEEQRIEEYMKNYKYEHPAQNPHPQSNSVNIVPRSTNCVRNCSSGGGSTSRRGHYSVDCQRPDSGFGSKDESAGFDSLLTPSVSAKIQPLSEGNNSVRKETQFPNVSDLNAQDSSCSSPEGGEILRKAPIRQPVLRKRRILK